MSKHARWLLGGLIIAGITAGFALRSRSVEGDTAQPEPKKPTDDHEPFTPYGMGPHPIAVEDLSAAEQEAIARVADKMEANQPPGSPAAYSAAVSATIQRVEIELAERQVGLVGTGDDGVVP
jgi:hypothetical protein